MSLNDGLKALKNQQYPEAVQLLEVYCQNNSDRQSPFYIQAQIALARAYRGNGELNKSLALCQELTQNSNNEARQWAKSFLSLLATQETFNSRHSDSPHWSEEKAARVAQTGIKLRMPKIADHLVFASSVTIVFLLGMVLALSLGLLLIVGHQNPGLGLMIAIVITLIFNGLAFLISPSLMDLTQNWLYKTRWVNLAEIKRQSPETADVILRVCREHKINHPRLGIIDDQNPTAFTYGSFPSQARLVVSQGLFSYLDDDEIATVYAHELGHIVHWDFAIMTLASTLVQITYLIYLFARELGAKAGDDNKFKYGIKVASITAYIFYIVGTYLMLYLSRTREYYADHFAAQVTGNPNGLSRSLVKIAYGIVEEAQKATQPSNLMEGTRALGIYDPKGAIATGTVYRISSSSQPLGRVFIWDLFNPWAKLVELSSTHPLTGKRIRALSTYAEQLGLETDFNMAEVVREGNKLNKNKLWSRFWGELLLGNLHFFGALLGFCLGMFLTLVTKQGTALVSFVMFGFGIGFMVKTLLLYPDFKRSPQSDILSLMCDPYASPVRGQPVQLQGQLIGRGDAGYSFGSDFKLQDKTGMIFVRYVSRFGGLGNFLFGATQAQTLLGSSATTIGWFRRGVAPWLDLIELSTNQQIIKSYPRFGALLTGLVIIILGLILPSIL
ncbi:peptidase M48 Ste24p [Rippkaea orientalis PCC 8801]|uniref:Peptidase M48 Ste24p n=1 Tax=Rippkaea orientalis (strain PCC 8801 / RF-1) TaxID=41431 RepID=B7JVR9_RIPO1|nr:zinc metalloprotease HtpX [Rippkaea orientalis]ACK64640.1 peptidase M48 Ste24p [Rippkaea orientalis PCC 8801]